MDSGTAIILILLCIVLIILGPILTIWALNTLFGLGIVLTWKTWLAALLLGGAVKGTTYCSKSD